MALNARSSSVLRLPSAARAARATAALQPAAAIAARTVWLTGLSGAGKSTLAHALVPLLAHRGLPACVIDGDQLRDGLSRDLGFSEGDRAESVRRAAELARLLNAQGIFAVVALISPLSAHREVARGIIGERGYFEVFVKTPLAVCEQRDPKGLYARARRGELGQFTGISAAYEAPARPAMEIDTQGTGIAAACRSILARLLR
jgi:adenylylsulfate kinase